jgi:hypothetical protein
MEPLTAPFAVPFVFGQPFTIDLESDVAYETVQGGFASTSLGGSFMTGPPPLQPVYDVNGNPILFVVFTPVPEPGSAFLGGAALLFGAVFVARSRQIRLL